jgi:glycosyltransferase involved in cell wall biosynthesis
MIKISVITPSYNQAVFIDATIRSVINQDYENFEYIVVDGGSTDGSVDIIRSYSDKIDVTIVERDNGQSNAINKGFRIASGEVLCWVNSDDLLWPGALKTVGEYFTKNADCQWLLGNCRFTDLFLKMHWHYKARQLKPEDYLLFGEGNFLAQSSVFFKKKLWQQAGELNENLHYAMDLDLWLRFLTIAPLHTLDVDLSVNRQYDFTKTNTGREKVVKEISTIIYNSSLNKQTNYQLAKIERSVRANLLKIEKHAFRTSLYAALNNIFQFKLRLQDRLRIIGIIIKNVTKKFLGMKLPA